MPDAVALAAHAAAVADATGNGPRAWEEPIPIDQQELPEFPVEALPPAIGAYVQALADETQTPLALAGSLALSVCASAIQRRYVVEIRPRYREQLSLWTLGLLDSAERKSAVFSRMLAPVYTRQADLITRGRPDRARALAELTTAEKRQDKTIRDASIAKREDMTTAICARDEAVEEVERLKLELPPEAVLLLDDVTPEQFAVILSEVGGVCVASPEGGVFANFFGRYNQKVPNLDGLLKSHSGDDMAVDRKNGTKLVICTPACSFAMVVQPDVLFELARKQEWMERGGAARFLYFMPRGNVGRRTATGYAMPDEVEQAYFRCLYHLLPDAPPTARADRRPDPFVMRLDAEARAAWEAFERAHEPRLHPETGDLGWCRSWGGKLAGQVARIAGQFQIAEHGPGDVGIDAMTRALSLAPYLEAHAVAALTAANERPGLKDARQMLRWIEETKPERFTLRDVAKANFGRDYTSAVDRADDAAEILEQHGYIRTTGAPRVDSKAWEPHPDPLGVSEVSDIADTKINSQKDDSPLSFSSTKPNEAIEPVQEDSDSGVGARRTLRTLASTATEADEAPATATVTGLSLLDSPDYGMPNEHEPAPITGDPGEAFDADDWALGIIDHGRGGKQSFTGLEELLPIDATRHPERLARGGDW